MRSLFFIMVVIGMGPLSSLAEERSLTLEEALQIARKNNPSIQMGRENASAAEQRVSQAEAGYWPSGTAQLSYKRATANNAPAPDVPSAMLSSVGSLFRDTNDSYNNFSAVVGVSHPIWDFGRTPGQVAAARAQVSGAKADLSSTLDNVLLSVNRAYFGLLAAHERLTLAQETLKQRERHLAYAQAQFQAGTRQKIDVTRAQADLAQAKLLLVQADNGIRLANLDLGTVIGDPEASLRPYHVSQPAESAESLPTSLESAVADALSRRPEGVIQKARMAEAEAHLRVIRSGYYPALEANGSVAYGGYEFNKDHARTNWNVGLSATWRFFTGFSTPHAVSEAEASMRVLQAASKSLDLSIRREVEGAWLTYQEAREKRLPAQALLDAGTETLSLAEKRYHTGLGNIVEVTDAQTLYLQASVGLIQIKFEREIARAALQKALGLINKG